MYMYMNNRLHTYIEYHNAQKKEMEKGIHEHMNAIYIHVHVQHMYMCMYVHVI